MKRASEGWMVLLEKDKSTDNQEFNGNGGVAPATSQGTRIVSTATKPRPFTGAAANGFGGGTMMQHCFAEIDERITFKPTGSDEYGCHLHIQNIAQGGTSIIYKIKTTSPDRYKVTPTIAVIECGGTARVPITSVTGVSPAQIRQDRFQVQVCILPKDMLNEEGCESVSSSTQSNFPDLNNVFKKILNSGGAAIDTFKIAVSVEGRTDCPTVSMDIDQMKKGLQDLEDNIIDALWSKIGPKLDRILMVLYMILAVLVCVVAALVMNWLNCGTVDCGTACPDYMPKAACGSCGGGDGRSWI